MPSFFERPILNSPYAHPRQHWELDAEGQPAERLIETRRRASFISPIPKAQKRKGKAAQQDLDIGGEEKVSSWRELKNPNDWGVTPETARLLQHWRHHQFSDIRPFFCQVEAIETLIWLTEVAPGDKQHGKRFLERLKDANEGANPGLMRLALKLATGAGKTIVALHRAVYVAPTRLRRRSTCSSATSPPSTTASRWTWWITSPCRRGRA